MKTSRRILLLVTAGALALSACGGDSNDRKPAARPPTTSAKKAPAGAAAARAHLVANWEKFFVGTPVERAAVLENSAPHQQELIQAQQQGIGAGVSASVVGVAFDGADRATVTYDILLGGAPVLPNQQGSAVFVDGAWRVSEETYCVLAALASQGTGPPTCAASAS